MKDSYLLLNMLKQVDDKYRRTRLGGPTEAAKPQESVRAPVFKQQGQAIGGYLGSFTVGNGEISFTNPSLKIVGASAKVLPEPNPLHPARGGAGLTKGSGLHSVGFADQETVSKIESQSMGYGKDSVIVTGTGEPLQGLDSLKAHISMLDEELRHDIGLSSSLLGSTSEMMNENPSYVCYDPVI